MRHVHERAQRALPQPKRAGILNHDGAFADFVRLPALNLHAVPQNVDDDQAVFVEPLAAAFQVLKQIKLDGRKWVTVLGDGRLGLLVAQVLRNAGCPVRVIGKHPEKLALCEKWSIRSRPLADIQPRTIRRRGGLHRQRGRI
jgi:threonine dehydrogenase-like Zn-dependent dehydrogenase